MNSDIFAEWLRRQGHQVIRTNSSYWVEFGPRVYQAFPYHHLIDPHEQEINQLLREQKAVALRYSTFRDAQQGSLSYHVVYERGRYIQSDLPKKARHDVKRGLSIAVVEPVSFKRLSGEGWELRMDTLTRQGRTRAETEAGWRRLCLSADGLPGFEAWGALVQGKLVASLLAFTCDGYVSILYQQSLSAYLRFGVNNALAFEVTSNALRRPGTRGIFYGLHSLDAPPSVDEFKFRMGYTAKPVRQRVVFHPYIQPLVNPLSHALLRAGRGVFPGNPALAKAEGMFRFCLQGKLPLARQALPAPLREPGLSQ